MTLCLAVFGLALCLLAFASGMWIATPALLLAGAMSVTYMQLNTALLLEQTEPEFHGRVMSFLSLDRGLMSAGAILGGVLAEFLGTAQGLAIMGAICSGLALLSLITVPGIRAMR
jgi:MFS family permease